MTATERSRVERAAEDIAAGPWLGKSGPGVDDPAEFAVLWADALIAELDK